MIRWAKGPLQGHVEPPLPKMGGGGTNGGLTGAESTVSIEQRIVNVINLERKLTVQRCDAFWSGVVSAGQCWEGALQASRGRKHFWTARMSGSVPQIGFWLAFYVCSSLLLTYVSLICIIFIGSNKGPPIWIIDQMGS